MSRTAPLERLEKGMKFARKGDLIAAIGCFSEVIEANPGPADDFRNGKEAALIFLKGQVMKASRGKANPQMVGELLATILKT